MLNGSFTHTRSLKLLLNEFFKYRQSVKDILPEKNMINIGMLEDAYTASRYLPREYEETEAREMLMFVKRYVQTSCRTLISSKIIPKQPIG